MIRPEKIYIIVRGEKILTRCYSKDEVKGRLRELLDVHFNTEPDFDEQGQCVIRADVWIEGKFSGHSYKYYVFSPNVTNITWSDVLKSDWFYNDTKVEVFETCPTLE